MRRPTEDLRRLSYVALVAGIAVAVARLITPFEHGIWLVAYLLLVGWLAALLLAIGESALLGGGQPRGRLAALQPALWAAGTITVPLGVLVDVRLLVALGSVALLVALYSMATAALGSGARAAPIRAVLPWAYRALVVFMAISVGVGMALASDIPWL